MVSDKSNDMRSLFCCWNLTGDLLQSDHNKNYDTKFKNILTGDLQYIVLVYNKLPIFGGWREKP